MNTIKEYYNFAYDEWSRLDRHPIEFEITKKVLKEFLDANSKVLDVGGGPGRYSIYLAENDHNVTLFDLSENLVEQAIRNASAAGVNIENFVTGNVLDLNSSLSDKDFDVVLCMGPMYHLMEEDERKTALRQCINKLKPQGLIIISFISSYAPIVDCLKGYPDKIKENKDRLFQYLLDGKNDKQFGFTDAYFINPESVETLTTSVGLQTIRIMATEGLGAACEASLMQLSENDFKEWIDLFYRIAPNKVIWGSCEHLLYVGRKE